MDDGDPPEDIVRYVIERKIALRDYELEENSFYVCKTSAGDVKKGLAPGTSAPSALSPRMKMAMRVSGPASMPPREENYKVAILHRLQCLLPSAS